MSVARRFRPTAAHTYVRKQSAHSLVPCALVGVDRLTLVDVCYALIPRGGGAYAVHGICSRVPLGLCLFLILMARYIPALAHFPIISRALPAATTCAYYSFHDGYYTAITGKYQIYIIAGMGNAVAVPVARWIGERIIALGAINNKE